MPANATNPLPLRDIHLPASPDLWPPAPGWWLLATLSLMLIAWAFLKYLKHRRQQKEQQLIFKNLLPIEQALLKKADNKALAKLNILLRQLALMHYPRQQIASLNGQGWLSFLDQSGETNDFSHGVGKVLADAPYRADDSHLLNARESKELLSLAKRWIKKVTTTQEHT